MKQDARRIRATRNHGYKLFCSTVDHRKGSRTYSRAEKMLGVVNIANPKMSCAEFEPGLLEQAYAMLVIVT